MERRADAFSLVKGEAVTYNFEVVLPFGAKKLFQEDFSTHMGGLRYNRMSLAGGEQKLMGFRRDDHLISLSITGEEHGLYRVVAHSETVPLDDLVLASLQEAATRLLEPFCQTLTAMPPDQLRESLLRRLGDLLNSIWRGQR